MLIGEMFDLEVSCELEIERRDVDEENRRLLQSSAKRRRGGLSSL